MTTATDESTVWVLQTSRVQEAIRALMRRRTHPFFMAYLHLRQVAARSETGNLSGLQPVWTEVSDILRVPDAPSDRPHLRPFWATANSSANTYWLNQNLAGSYAPSSLRAASLAVVGVHADKSFSLPEDHADKVLVHLLFGERMPAVPLAAFLLRDYGFINPTKPTTGDLVTLFREQYGIADDNEFETIYNPNSLPGLPGPWFQSVTAEGETPR